MAETSTPNAKRPPSPWWFAVAAVILVLGLVPFGWVLVNTVQDVVDYEVHGFTSRGSTTLDVEDDQVAVFSTYDGTGTIRCSGEGPEGDTPLEHPSTSLDLTLGSVEWSRVALTPERWDAGRYVVRCGVVSPGTDDPRPLLGYADNPSFTSTIVGFVIAVAVAIVAGLVALAIAIATGVKRHQAKKPPRPPGPEFPPVPPASG